ncbi:MAG TPA: hypothetical protein VF417_00725 [Candidatus Methylomirabilis sp.]
MLQATPAAHAIAQHLLAYEATRGTPAEPPGQAAVRACEQLRVMLSQLVGVAGFRSLLTRALTLAKRDVPWLASVEVTGDGALKGFGEGAQAQHPAAAAGGHALLAQLLGLLHTLIGEALTVRLLAGAWPVIAFDPSPPGRQENAR